MIILPIRIHSDEEVSLPQKVCKNCFEILTKAFKLREVSLESERQLRVSPVINIKPETSNNSEQVVFAEPFYENDDFSENFEISEVTNEAIEFSEDLHITSAPKQKQTSSPVWNYFGNLKNGNNQLLGFGYNFCSECLKNKKVVKYKTTTSSSSLGVHLEKCHGIKIVKGKIVEDSREVKRKVVKKERLDVSGSAEAVVVRVKRKITPPNGASTVCNECGKVFKNTSILRKHLITHGEKNLKCSR